MCKKLIRATIMLLAISLSITYASDKKWFEAYKSDAKIFFNNEAVNFDLPIVTIDGYTYIPLREAAEQANLNVKWDAPTSSIMLTDNTEAAKVKEIFDNSFGFALPNTAEIVNYDYIYENEEHYFWAKISFDEEDLEYLSNNFSSSRFFMSAPYPNDFISEELAFNSSMYPWWDLTELTEAVSVYDGVKTGVHKKTVNMLACITKKVNGQYVLYVSHV